MSISFIPVAGGGGSASGVENAQNFRYTVQAGDNADFDVSLPATRASANYRVFVTMADVTAHVTFEIPDAGRTTTQFNVLTSGNMTAGDTLDFLVIDQ